jgi:hypothetical protein
LPLFPVSGFCVGFGIREQISRRRRACQGLIFARSLPWYGRADQLGKRIATPILHATSASSIHKTADDNLNWSHRVAAPGVTQGEKPNFDVEILKLHNVTEWRKWSRLFPTCIGSSREPERRCCSATARGGRHRYTSLNPQRRVTRESKVPNRIVSLAPASVLQSQNREEREAESNN